MRHLDPPKSLTDPDRSINGRNPRRLTRRARAVPGERVGEMLELARAHFGPSEHLQASKLRQERDATNVAPGIATSNRGIATRSKDARGFPNMDIVLGQVWFGGQ